MTDYQLTAAFAATYGLVAWVTNDAVLAVIAVVWALIGLLLIASTRPKP